MSNKGYPGSPWLVPPEKAPKRRTAILILALGFALLFGSLMYNLLSILSGGFNFYIFTVMLILSILLILIGSILLAKCVAVRRYSAFLSAYNLKVCPHCGRQIPRDAKVCPYCGKSVEEANVK